MEQEELHKFVVEHTKRGTIRPSKSPYKAHFFFIKKKDGLLFALLLMARVRPDVA
jgi:hypothetical protein